MEEVVSLLIPVFLFLVVGASVALHMVLRFRLRREVQATYRLALERGSELTPEVIEALSGTARPVHTDMRRGFFWVAVGGSVLIAGLVQGEQEAIRPMIAVSSLPLLIGAAHLGLWQLAKEA